MTVKFGYLETGFLVEPKEGESDYDAARRTLTEMLNDPNCLIDILIEEED